MNATEPEFYKWKAAAASEFCALLEGKNDEEQLAALLGFEQRMLLQRSEDLAQRGLLDTALRPRPEPAFYKWKEATSAELNTLLEGKTPEAQLIALKEWEAQVLARREQLVAESTELPLDIQRH